MREDLNKYYDAEYHKEKTFPWLDDYTETATTYIPNTCLIEKAEAEKMTMDRTVYATTDAEQERRDYLYAQPTQQKIVRLEYLYQRTDAVKQQKGHVSADNALLAISTRTERLLQSPLSSSPATVIFQDSTFRARLANAKRVGNNFNMLCFADVNVLSEPAR